MDINVEVVFQSLGVLFYGLWMTIAITVISLFIALILGLFTALMKLSKSKILKMISNTYINIIRGTPLLVQVFYVYFALPSLLGFRIDAWTAAITALSLNAGAYIAEVFRSGIQAVSKGQYEAALAQGMTTRQTMEISPYLYFLVYLLIGGLYAGLYTAFGLASSLYMKNRYLILFTPFSLYIGYWIIFSLLGFLMTTVPCTYFVSTGWREWAQPNWTGPVNLKVSFFTLKTMPKVRTSKAAFFRRDSIFFSAYPAFSAMLCARLPLPKRLPESLLSSRTKMKRFFPSPPSGYRWST